MVRALSHHYFTLSLHSCTYDHEYNDPNDYFDIAHHEVDRQEELEYEVGDILQLYQILPFRLAYIHLYRLDLNIYNSTVHISIYNSTV